MNEESTKSTESNMIRLDQNQISSLDTAFKLPNKKLEEWRKIDIKRIKHLVSLPIKNKILEEEVEKKILKTDLADNSFRIIMNNNFRKITSNDLPHGIDLLSTSEIKRYLNKSIDHFKSEKDWLLNLNEKISDEIIGIKISVENITDLEIINPEAMNSLTSRRFLIVVEKSARLNLLEVITANNNSAHNNVIEIHVSENSTVNHGLIAIGQDQSSLLAKRSISQEINSNYSLNFFHQGWFFSRIEPEIVQINGNATTNLKGLQIAEKNQELSTFSKIKFNGPNGSLNQIHKAMVTDNSHSIFNGLIEVPQIAQQTNAAQLSKNLLLSEKGQIDTKPELRIIADDVKCSHGATISELEEDELFYLRSRGLTSADATNLIVQGYSDEIISQIPLDINRWSYLSPFLNSKS